MIAAARDAERDMEVKAEEENQLLLDDDEQPGGEMGLDGDKSLAKSKFEIRPVRAEMDPQSKTALETDLDQLKGNIQFNDAGLIGFNLFMHLFIIVTRHTREQFIKE